MMLFPDTNAAFGHLATAVRSGGRLAYVTWTRPEANGWYALPFQVLGAPVPTEPAGPFRLADPDENARLLTAAGLADVADYTVTASTWVGANVEDATNFLRRALAARLPGAAEAERIVDAARPLFEVHAGQDGVMLPAVALVCTGTRQEAGR